MELKQLHTFPVLTISFLSLFFWGGVNKTYKKCQRRKKKETRSYQELYCSLINKTNIHPAAFLSSLKARIKQVMNKCDSYLMVSVCPVNDLHEKHH